MAMLAGLPKPPSYPSGRYTRTNPLRREAGLRLLTESLPEPLRWSIVRAWRRPSRYSSPAYEPELPNPYRQRPDAAALQRKSPRSIGYLTLIEFEMARRVVEAPQARMLPNTRNAMLSEQSRYLRLLYDTLARQVGETNALVDFQQLLPAIG